MVKCGKVYIAIYFTKEVLKVGNKYSKLNIDKEKIFNWIELWCESELEGNAEISTTENNNRIMYTINNQGNIIKIDFIKCSGGLLTISPNVGVNVMISTKIADNIYERVKNVINESPFSNGFSIIIKRNDFDTVIELLKGMDSVSLLNHSTQLEPGKAQYHLYQFQGSARDTITIKYYLTTNRMQLQGKPLFLFNEVVSMVSESGVTLDDVVDAQLRYCSVNISNDDIYEEMKHLLGENAFAFLSTTQKAILSTALVLSKIEVDMQDYSGIIQQAFRAFEGFIKKLMSMKGIECEGDKQLGSIFTRPNKLSPFEMKPEYSDMVDDQVQKDFTAMYTFYYNKRHPYVHATARDFDTRIISQRKVADELFTEVLISIKSWHDAILVNNS